EDGVVELAGGEAHRAGGPERRLLDRVLDPQAQRLAVAEVAPDRLREERERDDHVLEAVPLQQFQDVLHARPADDRHHRPRLIRARRLPVRRCPVLHAARLPPLPAPPRERERAHVPVTSMRRPPRIARRADATYSAALATAKARPAQKTHSGQLVPSWVTRTK